MKDKKAEIPLIKKHTKIVEIGGKKYRLEHPGMRMSIRWKRECTDIKDGKALFDMEAYLDFAFEGCVFPIDHNFRPNLDDIEDPKEGEEWSVVLPRFLRGDDLEDFSPKEEKEKSQDSS